MNVINIGLCLCLLLSSLHAVSCPTLSNLTLIKWTDEQGEKQRIRIIEETSMKWRIIGDILNISQSKLSGYKEQYHHDNELCCREVLRFWLDGKESPQYPVTWDGLYELLDDVALGALAEKLSTTLKHLQKLTN